MVVIILCGFMSSGKTSVANYLAQKYQLKVLDTDVMLSDYYFEQYREPVDLKNMIRDFGEQSFRDHESEMIQALQQDDADVLALGGGAILRQDNVAHLKQLGHIIYLQANPNDLYERIMLQNVLPAFMRKGHEREDFELCYRQRLGAYANVANEIVDTEGMNIAEVAAALVSNLSK